MMSHICIWVHLCLACYRGELVPVRRRARGRPGGSAFDLADEAALELGERAELLERRQVLFAAEGGEHAGEVADRGDPGRRPLPIGSRVAARRRSS